MEEEEEGNKRGKGTSEVNRGREGGASSDPARHTLSLLMAIAYISDIDKVMGRRSPPRTSVFF